HEWLPPEDVRGIRVDFSEQDIEFSSGRQTLILVPSKIAVLAEQSPHLARSNVRELRDRQFAPFVWRSKRRPLPEQNHVVTRDPVPEPELFPNVGDVPVVVEI